MWAGPLAVSTDEYTASASESFTALLRDNDAAVVIGRRTAGVGCGYSNGGTQTLLEHSGLEIWLPDRVRHRRDGSNQRDGIAPDLAVDRQPGDSALEKGEKLRQAFNAWPPLESSPASPLPQQPSSCTFSREARRRIAERDRLGWEVIPRAHEVDPLSVPVPWHRSERKPDSKMVSPRGHDALQIHLDRWFPTDGTRCVTGSKRAESLPRIGA